MRENGKMKGAYAVKRKWIYLLAVCLGAGILIGFWQYREHEGQRQTKKNSIRIGVLLYRGMIPSSAPCAQAWRIRQRNMNRKQESR